jgi:hypothetical protein
MLGAAPDNLGQAVGVAGKRLGGDVAQGADAGKVVLQDCDRFFTLGAADVVLRASQLAPNAGVSDK